jgi:hypothetical protein
VVSLTQKGAEQRKNLTRCGTNIINVKYVHGAPNEGPKKHVGLNTQTRLYLGHL